MGNTVNSYKVTEDRPWGWYKTELIQDESHKVKTIVVFPNSRLSLQTHDYREEHWIVVKGEIQCTVGTDTFNAKRGDHIHVEKKQKHRISNNTNNDAELIEVQIGNYLGEDDITRYEDDYGRDKLHLLV